MTEIDETVRGALRAARDDVVTNGPPTARIVARGRALRRRRRAGVLGGSALGLAGIAIGISVGVGGATGPVTLSVRPAPAQAVKAPATLPEQLGLAPFVDIAHDTVTCSNGGRLSVLGDLLAQGGGTGYAQGTTGCGTRTLADGRIAQTVYQASIAGNTLTLNWEYGGVCVTKPAGSPQLESAETATTVFVSVLVASTPAPIPVPNACPAAALTGTSTLILPDGLGGRSVVDASEVPGVVLDVKDRKPAGDMPDLSDPTAYGLAPFVDLEQDTVNCTGGYDRGTTPIAALAGVGGAEDADTPEALALQRFIANSPDGPSPSGTWVLLNETGDEASYGLRRGPLGVTDVYTLHRSSGSTWVPGQVTHCTTRSLGDGRVSAVVTKATLTGNTIYASWDYEGDCGQGLVGKPTYQLAETPTAVFVTVLVTPAKAPGPGTVCAGTGLGGLMAIPLTAPLGTRTIIDASHVPGWPVAIGGD